MPDYPAIAVAYCEAVIEGRQLACKFIKLACKRYLKMLEMADDEKSAFYFSADHAIDFCRFKEKLPVGDNWRNVEFAELEPWQIWVWCAIYGFRRRGTGTRYTRWVYLEIPRKHDKSGSTAALGLFDLCFTGLKRPLVLIGAASEKQANHVFKPMVRIVNDETELAEAMKLVPRKDFIRCDANGGMVQKVCSIGKKEDGWNPNTIILDELHAQDPGVYEVLQSAMGARSNQILVQITTAGRHASGLAWDNRLRAIRLLDGSEEEYSSFAAIYTVDPEDMEDQRRLLTDERLWMKAMPMYGISIDPEVIKSQAEGAIASPHDREEFLRTRLNVWSNAASGLVDPQAWQDCYDKSLSLDYFISERSRCWIGVDLSLYNDPSAIGLIFEHGPLIAVFAKFFLPETSPTYLSPKLHAAMKAWEEQGHLTIQPGSAILNAMIGDEIRAYCEVFNVQAIAYDPAYSGDLFYGLYTDGLPVVEFKNRPWMITSPTEELLGRIHGGGLVHDGNGMLGWCMNNVVGDWRTDGTVMPKKDTKNSERKIDGFVALAMANGVRLNPLGGKPPKLDKDAIPDPYASRGLIGFEEVFGGQGKQPTHTL